MKKNFVFLQLLIINYYVLTVEAAGLQSCLFLKYGLNSTEPIPTKCIGEKKYCMIKKLCDSSSDCFIQEYESVTMDCTSKFTGKSDTFCIDNRVNNAGEILCACKEINCNTLDLLKSELGPPAKRSTDLQRGHHHGQLGQQGCMVEGSPASCKFHGCEMSLIFKDEKLVNRKQYDLIKDLKFSQRCAEVKKIKEIKEECVYDVDPDDNELKVTCYCLDTNCNTEEVLKKMINKTTCFDSTIGNDIVCDPLVMSCQVSQHIWLRDTSAKGQAISQCGEVGTYQSSCVYEKDQNKLTMKLSCYCKNKDDKTCNAQENFEKLLLEDDREEPHCFLYEFNNSTILNDNWFCQENRYCHYKRKEHIQGREAELGVTPFQSMDSGCSSGTMTIVDGKVRCKSEMSNDGVMTMTCECKSFFCNYDNLIQNQHQRFCFIGDNNENIYDCSEEQSHCDSRIQTEGDSFKFTTQGCSREKYASDKNQCHLLYDDPESTVGTFQCTCSVNLCNNEKNAVKMLPRRLSCYHGEKWSLRDVITDVDITEYDLNPPELKNETLFKTECFIEGRKLVNPEDAEKYNWQQEDSIDKEKVAEKYAFGSQSSTSITKKLVIKEDKIEEPYTCDVAGFMEQNALTTGNESVVHWYFRCTCKFDECNQFEEVDRMLSERIICRNGNSFEMCNSNVNFCKYSVVLNKDNGYQHEFINPHILDDEFLNNTEVVSISEPTPLEFTFNSIRASEPLTSFHGGYDYSRENLVTEGSEQMIAKGCAKSNAEAEFTSGCLIPTNFGRIEVKTCYCNEDNCPLPPLQA